MAYYNVLSHERKLCVPTGQTHFIVYIFFFLNCGFKMDFFV